MVNVSYEKRDFRSIRFHGGQGYPEDNKVNFFNHNVVAPVMTHLFMI